MTVDPVASAIRASMLGNRSRDTKPELAVRSALHRRGKRFFANRAIQPDDQRLIRPDIVFPRRRLAVFIDGCFWHGCPEHHRMPGTNRDYWERKIEINRARDESQGSRLRAAGWTVLRFWEHDDSDAVAEAVAEVADELARLDPE